jgi:hypothetical protein
MVLPHRGAVCKADVMLCATMSSYSELIHWVLWLFERTGSPYNLWCSELWGKGAKQMTFISLAIFLTSFAEFQSCKICIFPNYFTLRGQHWPKRSNQRHFQFLVVMSLHYASSRSLESSSAGQSATFSQWLQRQFPLFDSGVHLSSLAESVNAVIGCCLLNQVRFSLKMHVLGRIESGG